MAAIACNRRRCFLFLIVVILLGGNYLQFNENTQLKEKIARISRILSFRAPNPYGIDWGSRSRITSENMKVLEYRFDSPERFRVKLLSSGGTVVWNSRVSPERPELNFLEFTGVVSRISSDHFRVQIIGGETTLSEVEVDSDMQTILGVLLTSGGVTSVGCGDTRILSSRSGFGFQFEISVEPVCD